MVDEFQDTNRLQCELIDLVARRTPTCSSSATSSSRSTASATRTCRSSATAARPRRKVLPLTQNYRSRPEVLAVVNELFAGEFGDEFQPLHSSGEFPDPVFGQPVELLVTDKSSYSGTDVHWRRAEAQHIAKRVKELVDNGDAEPGEIVLLFAAGTDAEWYEEELRKAGLRDVPVDRARLLRPAAGRRPARVPAAAAQPLRRRGAADGARVAVRRRVERRARADPPRGEQAADLHRHREVAAAGARGARRAPAARVPPALRPARRRDRRGSRSSCSASASSPSTTTTSRCSRSGTAAAATRTCASSRGSRARTRSCAARDVEGFVRFVSEQEAVGARELEAVAEEEGGDAVRLLTIHAAKGLEFKVVVVADAGRDRQPPAPDEILALSDGRFGFKVAHPSTGEAAARAATRCARETSARRRPSGCASTTSR